MKDFLETQMDTSRTNSSIVRLLLSLEYIIRHAESKFDNETWDFWREKIEKKNSPHSTIFSQHLCEDLELTFASGK